MVILKNKCAIITGAAVGLGRSYAQALADKGVHLALCDVREEVVSLAEEIASKYNVNAFAQIGNVSDAGFVSQFTQQAHTHLGQIDILINNAGVWGASCADDPLDKSLDDFEHIFGTNFKGEFLFGRAVIPIMIDQNQGGDIINIATDHMVTCGTPHHICADNPACPWHQPPRPTGGGDAMDLYDASKWALNGLLFAWAKALKPHNIRVNAFCMGATDSHMLRSFHNFDPSPEEEASWMRAEDNAAALIQLLEEGCDGRNAENINFCVGRPVQLEAPRPHVYVRSSDV